MIRPTISHFRFPRRIARYSDQGSVFSAPFDTSVELRRIDDSTFLRELTAMMLLREVQCKVSGESRREGEAMVVVVLHFFSDLSERRIGARASPTASFRSRSGRSAAPLNRPPHLESHRIRRQVLRTHFYPLVCFCSVSWVSSDNCTLCNQKLWPCGADVLSVARHVPLNPW
jgi:hypothetical protein